MKICIVTCIHNRDDITKLFLEHITRLKKFFKMHKDIEIVAVAAISNCELEPAYLDKHLEVWFPFENRPLGYKFNAAIGATEGIEWDVMMLLGSDSLISARGIVTGLNRIKQGDKMIAFRDMGVVDLQDRSVYGWRPIVVPDKPYEMIPDAVIGAWVKKGRTIGSGRMISREIVEDMGYHLYDHNKDIGLDGSMEKNIYATIGYTFEALHRGQNAHSWALLELKSRYSIHTIDDLLAGGECTILSNGKVDIQRGFGIEMWNELLKYWEA